MKYVKSDALTKYKIGFKEFENYIKKINYNLRDNYDYDFHHGYLINLNEIERIKQKINYNSNESIYIQRNETSQDSTKYYTIKEIEFRNSDFLLNMIFNGNKYILINTTLWQLLCERNKEEKPSIKYYINKSKIKFQLDNKGELSFSNNNNLIDLSGLYYNSKYELYNSNYKSFINNTYQKIIDYYEYQKKFKEYLKSPHKSEILFGYLVEIDWFEKWKKYYDYDNIKTNYLEKSVDKKYIINYVILFQQINENNKIVLDDPKINKFSNGVELSSFLKKNKCVMINESLIKSMDNLSEKTLYYVLYENKIKFYFTSQLEPLVLDVNDNIILMKNQIDMEHQNLMQLTKIFYFQKFLSEEISKEHKIQKKFNYIFLIKKQIISQYLTYFNYETLFNLLRVTNIDYNTYEKMFGTIIGILKNNKPNYYEELKLKETKTLPFNFTREDYYLFPKTLDYNEKRLAHLSDFEIINNEIYSFFINSKMIQENQIIKGQYMAEEGNILLVYNYKGKNFYQIGSFEKVNGNFIVKYILEESSSTKDYILDIFGSFGINKLIQNIRNNKISLEYYSICYCYKISIDNSGNNEINIKKEEYDIFEIVSTLMSLYILEKDIKRKLQYSKTKDLNSNSSSLLYKPYKLISGDFIRQIKELFDYKKIKDIMNFYQINSTSAMNSEDIKRKLDLDYTKFLFNKEKEFKEIQQKSHEFFKIEKPTFEQGMDKFKYPIKFNILDEDLYKNLLKILNLKDVKNIKETEEILLYFNNGYIIFKGFQLKFCDNNNTFLYIYSLSEQEESNIINYHPEAVLNFQDTRNFNNQFSKIMTENIMDNIMKYPYSFTNEFQCKHFLLSDKNKEPQDSQIKPINNSLFLSDNSKDKFWNELLSISYRFYLEYNNFYDSMKILKKIGGEKFYLINKKYIDEIKKIAHFDKFKETLKNDNEIKNRFYQGNIDYLVKLKKSLSNEILTEFYVSKREDIEKNLNIVNIYDKRSKYFSSSEKLYYYENFQIINQKLLEIIRDLDYSIDAKCISILDLIISIDKAILWVNENGRNLINVGYINEYDVFVVDYIIKTENMFQEDYDIKKIFKIIKEQGYNYFKSKCIKDDRLYIVKDFKIEGKIYKISNEKAFNDYNIQTDSISEKLKGMILIAISQNIDINKFHEYSKNIEKVYLMNSKYLNQYKYEEISSLLNQNIEIQKLIGEINNPHYTYNPQKLEELILKLDKDKLKAIDLALQMAAQSNNNWEATPDRMALEYMKDINVYKNFVLIKEKLFKEIKKKLDIYLTETNFEYFYKDNADILVINNYSQPSIFYGYMNRESFMFNLTYILYFDHQSYMKKELEFIRDCGIKKYINEKTIFNAEDTKDLISPIYNEKYEIGTFYKYSPGTNYGDIKKGAYSSYIENSNLDKILKLYNYYNDFKENTNGYYEKESKYYLINKSIMDDIKKDYNYDLIIEILKKGQYNRKEKNEKRDKLFILKNLPEEVYEDFIKNNKQIEKRMKDFIAPNQISITIPNSQNESVNIYDNFEIIDSYNASQFISEISDYRYSSWGSYGYGSYVSNDSLHKDKNYVECTLKSGKIIIYYPKGELNKDKHVYIIGILDKKNTFKGEYLLFYTKDHYEFNKIKSKLSDYLKNLDQQLMYGPSPITNSSFEEIGKVLSLKELSSSNIQKMDIDNNTTSEPMDVVDEQYDFYNDNLNNEEKEKKAKKGLTTITKGSKFSEYNLDALVQSNSIQKNFGWPPLIGLDNIGATCYMNATLQCLCNIPKFINYFKYNKHLIDEVRRDLINTKNSTLSSSFKLLMEKLWPDRLYHFNVSNSGNNLFGNIGTKNTYSNKNNESYAPYEFKAKISKMNDLFKGVAANDAKDLVQFLIMTLHKELNLAQNQNLNNNAINQDQTNKQLMFKIFTQDFVNTNKSIISDLFYGVNYNTIQCQGCFTKSYNFQTYFFFVFPLEEVRIFKNQNNMNNFNNNMNNFNNNMNNFNNNINNFNNNMNNFNNNMNNFNNNMNNFNNNMINVNNNMNNFNNNMINVNNNMNNFNNNMNNNEINIYDCFYYDQRINYMSGQNAMYCNYCKNTCISAMCTNLAFGPEVIIIILNRGQGIQYKVKINFFEDLNLYNFIEYKETGVNYKLIGVVTHLGENDSSGHFIAYCKNPINLKWYQFNDSVVNEVINFKAEVIDYAMPYLLFYQKITTQ